MELEFRPTSAMLRCKANLHRACPPALVSNIQPVDPSLPKYISPTPMLLLRKWHQEQGANFWEWLLTPVEHDGKAIEARDAAYRSLMEILELPIRDAAGSIDKNVLLAKQKAIDTVLSKGTPMIAIQNNNSSSGAVESLPRGLKGQTEYQLADRLARLQNQLPAVPSSSSDTQTLEGVLENDNQ